MKKYTVSLRCTNCGSWGNVVKEDIGTLLDFKVIDEGICSKCKCKGCLERGE